jgi:hypothetical protein
MRLPGASMQVEVIPLAEAFDRLLVQRRLGVVAGYKDSGLLQARDEDRQCIATRPVSTETFSLGASTTAT